MSVEGAQINAAGAGPQAVGPKQKTKEGCFARLSRTLGLDVFLAIAFQGYNGSKSKKGKRTKRANPFGRGVLRNCQDFWMDGPIFGHKESNRSLLGGEPVDYAAMYDIPKGGMQYRGGYQEVATADTDEV
jgi:hypothetical protein